MIIIKNSLIPFKGYKFINICGVLFQRAGTADIKPSDLTHEAIHTKQIVELLVIGFYVLYLVEWLIRFAICLDSHAAYRSISLEREAYENQTNETYLSNRKPYAFIKFLHL